jgi:hypothetical protein
MDNPLSIPRVEAATDSFAQQPGNNAFNSKNRKRPLAEKSTLNAEAPAEPTRPAPQDGIGVHLDMEV